jgi:DnaJ-domain-containing protein 1
VSIGKRFVNLVRSNLNSLLEKSAAGYSAGGSPRIEDLSDEELEQEILRRRQRREAAERAADRSLDEQAWEEVERTVEEGSGRYRTSGRRKGGYGPATHPGSGQPKRDPRLAQLYAQLECPYGADLNTVRKHYRALMLKYHPDMHSGKPEKQRIATDLSQRLTMAYNELRRILGPPPP